MAKIFILLFCIWVIFSGYFEPFFLISGIISSFFIVVALRKSKITLFQPSFNWIRYSLWLFSQMILSSLQVTKLVWQRELKLSPKIKKIPHDQTSNNRIVILANSITLTPGTITIYHDSKYLYVHALVPEYFDGIQDIKKQLARY